MYTQDSQDCQRERGICGKKSCIKLFSTSVRRTTPTTHVYLNRFQITEQAPGTPSLAYVLLRTSLRVYDHFGVL